MKGTDIMRIRGIDQTLIKSRVNRSQDLDNFTDYRKDIIYRQ